MSIDVILLGPIKLSDGSNVLALLSMLWVYLFRFTAQGRPVAVPPIPSAPISWRRIKSFCCCIPRLANNNNDGQAQPLTEASVEREEITTFHEDKIAEKASVSNYVNIGNNLLNSAIDQRVHDIKDFLRRPVLCWTGSWSASSLVAQPLVSMAFPSTCIAKSSYKEKMRGFYGFRAKMVIRVQLNGQRFQQGRMLLHYLPETAEMQPHRKFTAMAHLSMITQQPRMDIDVAVDTEVIMEIPYVSNQLYSSLIDDTNDYGTFYLTPYTALKVGSGAASVQMSVWCHFEDVEIVYPTVPGLVTQSGIRRKKARGGASIGAVDVTDQELNSTGLGPISGLATRVSNAAGILSEIPLISAFTAPVSWASNIVARSALALGYSKPSFEGNFGRGVPTAFPNMHSVDGIDNSTKLALTSDNKVEMLPGFAGTDVDELAFSHILQIPSYCGSYQWKTADLPGSLLYAQSVNPLSFGSGVPYPTVSGTQTVYFHPTIGYVGNLFKYWRGSINFTFKIAKTEFHSGRLMFGFMPGKNRQIADAGFADSQYLFKEVFDLRTSSEFSVTVPFVALHPYLEIGDWSGVVYLWVLNPLTAPDTVNPIVDFVLEVCGGPDMEFAAPRLWNMGAINPKQPVLIAQSGIRRIRGLVPQGMAPRLNTGADVHDHVDNETVTQSGVLTTLEPAKFCIGERILSIRQLLKMSTLHISGTIASSSRLLINPWVTQVPVHVVATNFPTNWAPVDLVSYFLPLFRYYRGGMRFKVVWNSSVSAGNFFYSRLSTNTTPITFNTNGMIIDGNGAADANGNLVYDAPVVGNSMMGMLPEVEVPYYGNTHARHVYNVASNATLAYDNQKCGPLLQISSSAVTTQPRIYRAVADDFGAGFFIGTLPLV